MKKKIIAFLLLSIIVLTNSSISMRAEESKEGILLRANVETASGEKWGYINEKGNFVIEPVYDNVDEFDNKGIAVVSKGSGISFNVSFINKSGKVVSGPFYAEWPTNDNGVKLLSLSDGNGTIVVNESGKVILKSKYDIRSYSEGMLKFKSKKEFFGFLDMNGKTIIPAKYKNAQNFINGKSIVQAQNSKFYVINKNGKVLESLKNYNEFNSSSEGMTVFTDSKTEKYGFKYNNGTVAIKPKFYYATSFVDGFSIVSIEKNNKIFYGLIDKKGNYVIKPEYSLVTYLGQGLYSVNKSNGKAIDYNYSPKAIFNNKGKQLSDFKYYHVSSFEGNYASANDDKSSFFIDKNGSIVDSLPKLDGIGRLERTNNIVKANIDNELIYTKENGDIIWQKADTFSLGSNIKIKQLKYRKDYLTLVKYPEVSGMDDLNIQESVNKQLKKEFIDAYDKNKTQENTDDDYVEEVTIDYSAALNNNLLIINCSGYTYPLGAAHGMPSRNYYYIDIKTGAFYKLKDLFKTGSNYTNKLTSIVNKQLILNNKIAGGYSESKASVSENQYFIIGKDSLKIYYLPYEIACYAAGFPEFEIPYGQISDIIDTNGAFWNSFDKTIK